MTRRFVITGCGRSGTSYTAELLNRLGCTCTHEKFFTGKGQPSRIAECLARAGLRPLQWRMPPWGEAAWEAAPLLSLLPGGTPVFHQLRHPLEFIRSRQKKGWVHGRFRHRHLPQFPRCDKEGFASLPLAQQADLLARFWIDWNALVESRVGGRPYMRYRIEDFDLGVLLEILTRVDFPHDPGAVGDVFEALPTNVNTRGRKRDDITPDLLTKETRRDLEAAAARYGYRL
ncbi:hypothetical protein [Microbulbifer halophilus]|uniref:Sulfotransferase family protein n=1 Tax=Microbulbifer halophilus TaxID=453963 RepID=A0ABW5E9V5_9GAMM|nr:hypothetical protein [Microbulbifer halophilus]MCW8126802.1 hypothetical protein [Microbulbifer halophilus]